MLDLICLGSVSIDLYYKGTSLTEGEGRFELAIGGKYYVDHFYEGLGGGGANVAIGVAHAGLHAGLIAKIGNNLFKSIIYKKLDDEHIVHEEFCSIEEDYTNISSILLNTKGEKTIVNYRTPDQQLLKCEDDYDKIEKAESIYMANLANVSWEERLKILQFAKSRGKKVFANLNVTDCRRPLEEIISFIENIDVLIINGYEYADIVKSSYESIDFQSNIIEKFMPFTKNHLLVITNGKKGSYAYHDLQVYTQEAIHIENVLDSTGAGDGYTAGFIASYLKTSDIQNSMTKGAEYAVQILGKIGAN